MKQPIIWISTSLIMLAALTACNIPTRQATTVPLPSEPATAEPEPTLPPTSSNPDAGRYRNEAGLFSLQLPDRWSAAGPFTTNNDPDRPFDLYVLGTDPVPEGGPGISRIVIADPAQWTPETFVQAQCSTCDPSTFEQVSLGGKLAQRTQVGGGDVPFTVTWYFVENNGKLIGLAIHDPETLATLEEVIQSIQFK